MKRNTHTYVKTGNGYKLYREYNDSNVFRTFGYYGRIKYDQVTKRYGFVKSFLSYYLRTADLDYASKILKELEARNDG